MLIPPQSQLSLEKYTHSSKKNSFLDLNSAKPVGQFSDDFGYAMLL